MFRSAMSVAEKKKQTVISLWHRSAKRITFCRTFRKSFLVKSRRQGSQKTRGQLVLSSFSDYSKRTVAQLLVFERRHNRLFGISSVDDLIGVFEAFTESTLHSVPVVDPHDLRHAFHLPSFQPVLLGLPIACSSASPRTSRTLRVRLSRVKGF